MLQKRRRQDGPVPMTLLLNTPEDLYGREACQCNRTSQESYQRIFEHLKEILPDASDKQIVKLIG